MITCPDCNKQFFKKSNLNRHQLSKACTETCTFCDQKFPTSTMRKHEADCIEAMKRENQLLKNQLLISQEKMQEMTVKYEEAESDRKRYVKQIIKLQERQKILRNTQPTTTINNNNITIKVERLQVLNFADFEKYAEKLTIEHIKKGASGYAEFALTYPLNNRIVCTDYSRRKVKFKAPNNQLVNDVNLSLISAKLFQSLITRNREEIFRHIDSVDDIEEKMRLRLLYSDYINLVRDGSQGIKHTLYPEFVKEICTLTN